MEKNEFNTKYLYFLMIIIYVYGFVKFLQISDSTRNNIHIPIKCQYILDKYWFIISAIILHFDVITQ